MKCLNDGTEMEEGDLMPIPRWAKGFKAKLVKAFRCPKCGKIELISEPDKN